MTFIGKNPNFQVIWSCAQQAYDVFYKGKALGIRKFRFRDVKSYLD